MKIDKNKKLLPNPILSVVLVVIWLLLNNTIAFGQVLLGLFLGFVIPLFTTAFWPEKVNIKKPTVLLKFAFMVLYDILIANITVAIRILGPTKKLTPAFFEVPLDSKNPLIISVLSSAISPTLGSVSRDLSDDSSPFFVLCLHVVVVYS